MITGSLIVIVTLTVALEAILMRMRPLDHYLLVILVLAAVALSLPLLLWNRRLRSGNRVFVSALPLIPLIPFIKWHAASWFPSDLRVWISLVADSRLAIFALGATIALALFHLTIFYFDRTDITNMRYGSFVVFSSLVGALAIAASELHLAISLIVVLCTFVLVILHFPPVFEDNLYIELSPWFRRHSLLVDARKKERAAGTQSPILSSVPADFVLTTVIVAFCLAWQCDLMIFLALLCVVLLIAISILAVRTKRPAALVLGLGSLILVVVCISALYRNMVSNTVDFSLLFGLLGFAGSMSIYLARKFILTIGENARKDQELEEARNLQLSMLPQEIPSVPYVDISWYMETATEVGGDYYDYSLGEDGTLTVTLGDATGHGMQAGTIVTATKSLFLNLSASASIVETFTAISRSLKGMNLQRSAMAMNMVKIRDRTMQVSSAGNPPILLYRARTQAVEEILLEGMPLGYSTRAQYKQQEFDLEKGDTILLMSDGLPERLNETQEYFGYPRSKALFAEVAEHAPDEICQHLAQGGENWASGRPQDDDVTFVVLKVKA